MMFLNHVIFGVVAIVVAYAVISSIDIPPWAEAVFAICVGGVLGEIVSAVNKINYGDK